MSDGLRSLGIIIYPDGSQAEIWVGEAFGVPLNGPYIKRLAKPRKLTFAPYFLLALLSLGLSGCVHLQRVGDKPICLLDYETGIKHCEYDTWEACHADLHRQSMCYKR